jgi:hypothetical protein
VVPLLYRDSPLKKYHQFEQRKGYVSHRIKYTQKKEYDSGSGKVAYPDPLQIIFTVLAFHRDVQIIQFDMNWQLQYTS